MAQDDIDLERAVYDPLYRREVMERLGEEGMDAAEFERHSAGTARRPPTTARAAANKSRRGCGNITGQGAARGFPRRWQREEDLGER